MKKIIIFITTAFLLGQSNIGLPSESDSNAQKHQMITIDDRPVALIQAKGTELTSDVKDALKEGRIRIINDRSEMLSVISENTILVISYSVDIPGGTLPDLNSFINIIKTRGLVNIVDIGIYNQPGIDSQRLEALSPTSIHRDQIVEKLSVQIASLKKDNKLGHAPRLIFIAFRNTGRSAGEAAVAFSEKSSLITIDAPTYNLDLSKLKSIISFYIPPKYEQNVDKALLPEKHIEVILLLEKNVDIDKLGFLSSSNHANLIVDAILQQASQGVAIGSCDLKFEKKK